MLSKQNTFACYNSLHKPFSNITISYNYMFLCTIQYFYPITHDHAW